VEEAESAIAVQFQAHTCLQLGFCHRTEEFVDWIESNTYGTYPKHKVPIESCSALDKDPKMKKLGAEKKSLLRKQLCTACEKVIDVNIQRGSCVTSSGPVIDVLQPGVLEKRCTHLANTIGDFAKPLLTEFKSEICNCLGCCGDGKCFFPDVQKEWLKSLVTNVHKKVSRDMNLDGWSLNRL
jgi:hypothetical protein